MLFLASQTSSSWHCTLCVTSAFVLLAAGRRLAELELVLLLVQVCVLTSFAVCIYVMVYIVNSVYVRLYEGVSAQVYGVWFVVCVFHMYVHACLCVMCEVASVHTMSNTYGTAR